MGRRAVAAALTSALCACSLLTSTDGLSGGTYPPDAAASPAPPQPPPPGTPPPPPDDAGGDASDVQVAVTADAHRATVMADGPLAYYRLADPSGTVAKDETGNFNGTYFGSPILGAAGPFAGQSFAAHFGGGPQRVEANALANRNAAWTELTIEAWCASELAAGVEGDVAQFSDPAGNTVISLFRDDATNAIKAHVGAFFPTAPTPLLDASWHHVALTMASNAITLYLDGVLVAQSAGMQAVPTSGLFGIGVDWNANDGGPGRNAFWHGRLAEVAVYDKELAAAQIAAHAAR